MSLSLCPACQRDVKRCSPCGGLYIANAWCEPILVYLYAIVATMMMEIACHTGSEDPPHIHVHTHKYTYDTELTCKQPAAAKTKTIHATAAVTVTVTVTVTMAVTEYSFVTTSVLFLFVFTHALPPYLLSHVSPLYTLLIPYDLYTFVSLSVQLLLINFIYWSSPLLSNKILVMIHSLAFTVQVTTLCSPASSLLLPIFSLCFSALCEIFDSQQENLPRCC